MNFKSFNDSDPRDNNPDLWDEFKSSKTMKDFKTRLKGLWWMLEDVKRTVDFMQGDIPDEIIDTTFYYYLLETLYHAMEALEVTTNIMIERIIDDIEEIEEQNKDSES